MAEPLERPLRAGLDTHVDEETVQRLWQGTVARRGRARARRRAWIGGGIAGAVTLAAVMALALWHGGSGAPRGALHLVDGPVPARLAVAEHARPRALRFDDGSVLRLAPGASLDVLENDGDTFSLLLARGRARFDVRPGGGRVWEIACGLATVRVLGTAFVLERSGETLRVSVQRGAVLVRGDGVADGARRLLAGESITVTVAATAASTPEPVAPPAHAQVLPARDEAPTPARPQLHAPPAVDASWRTLAQGGAWDEAYGSLGAGGVSAVSRDATVDDLFLLADVCRLGHHPDQAVAPLREAMSRTEDPRAGLAAFTLGRLELDRLDRPADAVTDLERAIALGLPRGLVADAQQRLDDARARAADRAP